jgi:hypothetical protein
MIGTLITWALFIMLCLLVFTGMLIGVISYFMLKSWNNINTGDSDGKKRR